MNKSWDLPAFLVKKKKSKQKTNKQTNAKIKKKNPKSISDSDSVEPRTKLQSRCAEAGECSVEICGPTLVFFQVAEHEFWGKSLR